jgi:polyhydroxyalkanoate synthesis regulator phasin
MLEQIFHTGLGGAILLKERVEMELEKLEEKGKLSKEDAKTFLDGLKTRGEEEEAKLKATLKDVFKEVADELGLATKEDIQDLKKRD